MPEWLRQIAPEFLYPLLEWLTTPAVFIAAMAVSVLLIVLSLLGLPYLIVRLPVDYFSASGGSQAPWTGQRLLAVLGRNLLGLIVLLLGIVMCVGPGQGVLAIIMALLILDFPGKSALRRKLAASPKIFRALNTIRRRAGVPPLERGE